MANFRPLFISEYRVRKIVVNKWALFLLQQHSLSLSIGKSGQLSTVILLKQTGVENARQAERFLTLFDQSKATEYFDLDEKLKSEYANV